MKKVKKHENISERDRQLVDGCFGRRGESWEGRTMALTGARLGARLSGAPTTVTRSLFGEGRHTEADLLTWIRCTAVSTRRRLFNSWMQ